VQHPAIVRNARPLASDGRRMGLYDTIILVDRSAVVCPHGHEIEQLQTKDFEPNLETYLVLERTLVRVVAGDERPRAVWRPDGARVVEERRHDTEVIAGPQTVRAYGSCDRCEPLLVRTDARAGGFGDLVHEHSLSVDVQLVLRPGLPLEIVRTSGTRDDLRKDLQRRGLHVLGDDEPLAMAHREAKQARERLDALSGGRRLLRW
jgi:hypothetical protein